jgi:hypothetical protein
MAKIEVTNGRVWKNQLEGNQLRLRERSKEESNKKEYQAIVVDAK